MSTRIDPRGAPLAAFTLLLLLSAIGPAAALDPPASKINPKTGAIEIVDPVSSGSSQDLRYVISDDSRAPQIESVTADPSDDRSPRLAITGDGDAWIVWWRDLDDDQVFVRSRTRETSSWGAELRVSDPDERSSRPDIVHDGTRAWVAYEIADAASGSTSIAASIIDTDPDPVGIRVVLGSTVNPYERDVRAHHEAGHVWISWIQSNVDVGWARYDASSETWTLAEYESYANDSIEDARERIRATVTGN